MENNNSSEPKATRHHYISRCYLKYFGTKKRKIHVIYKWDKKEKKQFKTNTRDAGLERDFNKDIKNSDPYHVEKSFANELENHIPVCIDHIIDNKNFPEQGSREREILITFISKLAVSTPGNRALIKSQFAYIDNTLNTMINGKENSLLKIKPKSVTIGTDLDLLNAVAPYLNKRKWELLISKKEYFICSDSPVSLVNYEHDIPFIGFGTKFTAVIFPLTKTMCLVGKFEGEGGTREVCEAEVRALNRITLTTATRFIYSSEEKAYI